MALAYTFGSNRSADASDGTESSQSEESGEETSEESGEETSEESGEETSEESVEETSEESVEETSEESVEETSEESEEETSEEPEEETSEESEEETSEEPEEETSEESVEETSEESEEETSEESEEETSEEFDEKIEEVIEFEEKVLIAATRGFRSVSASAPYWKVELISTNSGTYAGVIGEIQTGATVNLKYINHSTQDVVSGTGTNDIKDVGAICGIIQAGATLVLEYSEDSGAYSIISQAGNSGGLIGSMISDSTLTIKSMPSPDSGKKVVAKGSVNNDKGYAGGLAGYVSSEAVIAFDTGATVGNVSATVIPVAGSVKGNNGAGAVYGCFDNVTVNTTIKASDYNVAASVYGLYCGGLIGVLKNNLVNANANTLTITDVTSGSSSGLQTSSGTSDSDFDFATTGYFGGLVGRYVTDDLKNTLLISNFKYKATSAASFASFGGAIGIADSAAYIKAEDVSITAVGTNKRTSSPAYFGGLIGKTSEAKGVFVDLGNFTLNTSNEQFRGGGVVGQFIKGVLRLGGITDMSAAKPQGGYSATDAGAVTSSNYGQIVGNNNNVLVYALGDGSDYNSTSGTGWNFIRSNGAISDDLGTWGEVIRTFSDDGDKNAEDAGIVTVDSTNHTVTLASAVTTIGNNVDFARTALNIMLNQGTDYDCLKFSGSTRNTLLSSTALKLNDSVDLSGTGINGFMRDGSSTSISSSNVGDVGIFVGTFDGNNKKITVSIGESYGLVLDSSGTKSAEGEGSGCIYRHRYNGLFSVIGDGTTKTGYVKDLTVDGDIIYHNAGVNGIFIGGIAARSHGNTTLENIKISDGNLYLTVSYHEGAAAAGTNVLGECIGGFIGYIDENSDNGTVAITGTSDSSPKYVLSGSHGSWDSYGGIIGKIVSPKFVVDIAQGENEDSGSGEGSSEESLTIGMIADVSGITSGGANTDSGGLIGYIISKGTYSERKVNIKNLEFDGCVIGNCSSTNAGGFLGYSWLNTETTINGLNVKNGVINNTIGEAGSEVVTSKNVGVMCYCATGKWDVDSLTIENMTMDKGAGTSLGMIVNTAYDDDSATKGLYLDLLNEGYILTDKSGQTGIILPASLAKYDEIAAYSAANEDTVINGGTVGIISVDMNVNSGTKTKVTETGTYQNQLSAASSSLANAAKYPNKTTRYYYNIQNMSKNNDGENFLLWSLTRYVDSSNKSMLPQTSYTGSTIAGNIDLTGLSYYPIKLDSGITFSGTTTVTFGYSGIYTAESSSTFNTDSYNRDPGAATSTSRNQHYLMHSGLFFNLPSDTTINVNSGLTLAGDFLELPEYQGVIISQTMNGSFKCGSSSSITLNGITPKTAGNLPYTSGYLLINKVKRENDLVNAPEIYIQRLSTTSAYNNNNTTPVVASSLIGPAEGKALKIEFKYVRLDARSSASAVSGDAGTELNNAYGTYNSIFGNATLIDSIYTDLNAQLQYNYTHDEDWAPQLSPYPRYVTYGKEVKDSQEYQGKENKYLGSNYYTDPTSDSASSPYDFSSWRPYVRVAYSSVKDADGKYQRELKVNVTTEGLTEGCGTYDDPYIISSATQLEAVALFIKNGSSSDWKITLPKTQYNGVEANTKGSRWCGGENNHAKYSTSGNGFTPVETGPDPWSNDNVRLYLAGAYYKITGDSSRNITLSDTYVGLGDISDSNTSGKYAFRGVIVGSGTGTGGVPSTTITNNSSSPLINVSNGSVIKDINIVVAKDTIELKQEVTGQTSAYFGYNSKCTYYGGIIGEIMGGDNIVDNCYVDYSYMDGTTSKNTKIKLIGTDSKGGTIVPVGGYVGVVVFGGLIFKNMNATMANSKVNSLNVVYKTNSQDLSDNNNQYSWSAIYVNPFVGRVINGYAVNETNNRFTVSENGKYHDENNTSRFDTSDGANADKIHSLKNGAKHYSIADINISETNKLSVDTISSSSTDGSIQIPNAQAFFILSLITQSCAGTAQSSTGAYTTSLSYGTYSDNVYGMSRNGDYSNVGNVSSSTDDHYKKASKDTAGNTADSNYAVPYIIRYYTKANSDNYPARCVTSTAGYYDIDLTGKTVYSTEKDEGNNPIPLDSYTYELPDSYRGLGCVGIYDFNSTPKNNLFCIKLDEFDGDDCAIDEDIYVNKFLSDNYFGVLHKGENQILSSGTTTISENNNTNNHGVGLFDSVVMKNNASKIGSFTLSGSLRTAVYVNTYGATNREYHNTGNNNSLWMSVGGVCGWNTNTTAGLGFEKIILDTFSVAGTNHIGGLLGYSGLKSKNVWVRINQCSATNLSIKAVAAMKGDNQKSRSGMGAFVGKVQEGAVYIYGTEYGESNTNSNLFSTVKIKEYSFSKNDSGQEFNYYMAAGGLVGFCGNGCRIYDMHVSPETSPVTIGGNQIRFAGGMVGGMQSYAENERTGIAVFKNCVVENINVNGNFAGGYYGGKWDSGWTTYSLTFDNCKLIGSATSHNTIFGNSLYGDSSNNSVGSAGGLVGRLYPYSNKDESGDLTHNLLIKDCIVSNYDISSATVATSYAGGFIGNASSVTESVTCYIHDSSVENCTIGADGNYAGGIFGKIVRKNANQLLGYNIKLDNIETGCPGKMGAWIGYTDSDSSSQKTSIKFAGLAIYGQGFSKNIGNNASIGTASFVFADYSGKSRGSVSTQSEAATSSDTNSVTESYDINEQYKKITRTIVTVTVSGGQKTTKTQTVVYRYGTTVTSQPEADENITADKTTWSINESEGKILKVVEKADNKTRTTTTYSIAVSGYNSNNNVDMPKYPFVNVNPQSSMGSGEIISGDAAVLLDSAVSGYSGTAAKTTAAKIYADIEAGSDSRRYTTFNDATIYGTRKIKDYLTRTKGSDGDRISTYGTEASLPENVDDFAVVVIANVENDETTELIKRYIQLVTNTTTNYSASDSYYQIVINTCRYNASSQKFEIITETTDPDYTPGLTFSNGVFALNGAKADSNKTNTFTLVDVQFNDPFNTSEIAYHLYVPVYTIKQMSYGFKTHLLSGTISQSTSSQGVKSTEYTSILDNPSTDYYVDSLRSWFTQYVRFTYPQADIQSLIDSGSLNWNFKKKMLFSTRQNSLKLPGDTYMILIDPNGDMDSFYTAKASDFDSFTSGDGWIVEFEKFKDTSPDKNNFSASSLAVILSEVATATAVTGNGKYDEVNDPSKIRNNEYTLYLMDANKNKRYYQYNSSGNGGWNISVSADVNEDYYINMWVPRVDGYNYELYFFTISGADTLEGSRSAKIDNSKSIQRNALIADLYSQKTTIQYEVQPSQQEITETNNTITVKMATTIKLENGIAREYLNNKNLYHSFKLELNRYSGSGMQNDIQDLDEDKVVAKYGYSAGSINNDAVPDLQLNYLNIKTADIMNLLRTNTEVTIYSEVQMPFEKTNLQGEFPQKAAGEENIGVNVAASSNLAYKETQLVYSTMSEAFAHDNHYYYIESFNTAVLRYDAKSELDQYDKKGALSQNFSRLGINGKNGESLKQWMPITSEAVYNVSMLDSVNPQQDKIRLTFTLNKKTDADDNDDGIIDKADYAKITNIKQFIDIGEITSGSAEFTELSSSDPGQVVFIADAKDCYQLQNGFYQFVIPFDVKTGDGFTHYANYQVYLQAEMINQSGTLVENSRVRDYLVYTNAKVYADFIQNVN